MPSPLLLVSEQGFGDTLMMLRFALQLVQEGIELQLVCQNSLVELIQHAAPGLDVQGQLVRRQALPQPWLPLLSLPRWLGATDRPCRCRRGICSCSRRLVALHWQDNPVSEQSLYSRGRSLPLQALAPLAELADLEFVSL